MGKMIKDGGDKVVGWIWRLYNMTFESGGQEDKVWCDFSIV